VNVDLGHLENEIYRCGRVAFQRIRDAHPGERFYTFAFYTSGGLGYAASTASTYEGLEAVARKYQKNPMYSTRSLEQLKRELKWSPCDSPLHCEADDDLADLGPLMAAVSEESYRLYEADESGSLSKDFDAKVRTCFANALNRLDQEGAFGRGDERRRVVVNLLMGDQSDEDRLSFAARVNPPELVEQYRRELAVRYKPIDSE
jgi:hypothetical protein